MKRIMLTIVLIVFMTQINAQIAPGTKIPKSATNKKVKIKNPTINPNVINQDLNYYQIEYNIKNNSKCYSVTTTINGLNSAGFNYAGYTALPLQLKNNYLYVDNNRLTGTDSNRSRVEVTISPTSDLHAEIDKDNILVAYDGALGDRIFKLKHVTIQRSKHGILITGSVEERGVYFGVNICIYQVGCLI